MISNASAIRGPLNTRKRAGVRGGRNPRRSGDLHIYPLLRRTEVRRNTSPRIPGERRFLYLFSSVISRLCQRLTSFVISLLLPSCTSPPPPSMGRPLGCKELTRMCRFLRGSELRVDGIRSLLFYCGMLLKGRREPSPAKQCTGKTRTEAFACTLVAL